MCFPILDPLAGETRLATAAEIAAEFHRTGVVVFPGFFDANDLAPVNRELCAHHATLTPTVGHAAAEFACDIVPWDPCREGNRTFQRFRDSERLRLVTDAALGPGWTAPGSLVMYSVAGGRGQAWHQDCPADRGDARAFNLNRLIYTEDVALADGAIVFVPGSHRAGRIPPGDHQEPMAGEVTLEPRAGTLVFLHGHVFHRVTPNRNHKPRVSVNFRAFPAGTPPSVTCIGVYRNGSVNFCDQPKQHDGTPAVPAHP